MPLYYVGVKLARAVGFEPTMYFYSGFGDQRLTRLGYTRILNWRKR